MFFPADGGRGFFGYNHSVDGPLLPLIGFPPDMPAAAVRAYAAVGSTNTLALDWAAEGAPDGALVVADFQSAGRGRLNRRWVTQSGAALAFSLIVRPTPAETAYLGQFTALAALGLAEALEALGLHPQIKWPNDVLLGGRKTAGILVEAAWDGDRLGALVVGVGVNVAPSAVPPAEAVMFPATCVETALGRPVERWQLLRGALGGMAAWRARLGSPAFLEAWQGRLAFRGQRVCVDPPHQPPVEGVLLGVEAEGSLRLRTEAGQVYNVIAGDVHLRPLDEGS